MARRVMLRVQVITVGKLKEKWLSEAVAEYSKRLGRFCRLEIEEVGDERIDVAGGAPGIERGLRREGDRALSRIAPGAYVVVADIRGEAPDSVGFAGKIGALLSQGRGLAFVVGGSHGVHADVLARADWRLSMSRMTFPHQLARLILVEQIYRAFKILADETYHK